MNEFLRRLIAFLWLGAIEEEGDVPADAATEAADETDADTSADAAESTIDDLIDDEPAPVKKAPAADDREELRARAERAERALSERQPPPARGADPETEREDTQLAQAKANGATAEQLSWLQWQIDSNRKMRASERTSQQALQQARDIADRSEFGRLETTQPKLYKRYNTKVEQTIAEMRSRGEATPPRMVLLRVLLGEDMLNGNIKPKAKAAGAAPATVPRGRSPTMRSDVHAKSSGASEHEKREARLLNRII